MVTESGGYYLIWRKDWNFVNWYLKWLFLFMLKFLIFVLITYLLTYYCLLWRIYKQRMNDKANRWHRCTFLCLYILNTQPGLAITVSVKIIHLNSRSRSTSIRYSFGNNSQILNNPSKVNSYEFHNIHIFVLIWLVII